MLDVVLVEAECLQDTLLMRACGKVAFQLVIFLFFAFSRMQIIS